MEWTNQCYSWISIKTMDFPSHHNLIAMYQPNQQKGAADTSLKIQGSIIQQLWGTKRKWSGNIFMNEGERQIRPDGICFEEEWGRRGPKNVSGPKMSEYWRYPFMVKKPSGVPGGRRIFLNVE